MKTLAAFAFALALGTGAGVTLGKADPASAPSATATVVNRTVVNRTNDAAFRDGLFQAKLAVERGAQPHIAIGRWASDENRASFTAGYQQGYALASGGHRHKSNVVVPA